jgi:hypothetical protein
MSTAVSEATAIGPVTNGAEAIIELTTPYIATVLFEGTADFLFHRWNCEAVEEKAKAAKGSKAKKSDDIESYVYRDGDGLLAIPGMYFRGSLVGAARYQQDPRSPRKSAMDLYKAGVVPLTELAPLGVEKWDYEHKGRVVIQRSAVTRTRPAMKAGWQCEVQFLVTTPEYINPHDLQQTFTKAGQLIGVGDFRPTYGRFLVRAFQIGLSD